LADLYAETPSVHSRSAALTLGLAIHEKSELTNVCNESVNWVVQFDESGTRVGVAKKTESTWELTLVGSAGLGIPSETVRLDEETQDIQLVFLSDWIQSQVAQPVNPDLSIQATRTCLGLVDAPITDIPPETIEPTLNPSLFSQIDFSIHGGGALDVRFLRSEAGIFSFIKGNCGYEIPDYTKPSTEVTDSALAQALEKLFTGQITVQKNEPNPLPTGTFRAVTTTDPQGALQEYANPSLSNVGGGSELDTIFAFASQACTQP
jgi:hypothetical protein